MKTKPPTEYIILGSLSSGPKHGYEIMRFLRSALESAWSVGTSQLYSLLKRLEKEDLLQSILKTQDTRPSKRVFRLTKKGEGVFLSWLKSPTENVRDFRLEFIGKLFFYHKLSLNGALNLIEAQIVIHEEAKKRLLRKKKKETDPFRKLLCEFKLETVRGQIRWLSERAGVFARKSEKPRDQRYLA